MRSRDRRYFNQRLVSPIKKLHSGSLWIGVLAGGTNTQTHALNRDCFCYICGLSDDNHARELKQKQKGRKPHQLVSLPARGVMPLSAARRNHPPTARTT